jgi:hypothetical protein
MRRLTNKTPHVCFGCKKRIAVGVKMMVWIGIRYCLRCYHKL